MQIIRSGITRTVVLTWRYAIKVPSWRGIGHDRRSIRGRLAGAAAGVLASRSEYDWHQFEGWQPHVAPVLHSWLGGLIQVYPRCRPVPARHERRIPQIHPAPGDSKLANVGMLRRRMVWIDYDMS